MGSSMVPWILVNLGGYEIFPLSLGMRLQNFVFWITFVWRSGCTALQLGGGGLMIVSFSAFPEYSGSLTLSFDRY